MNVYPNPFIESLVIDAIEPMPYRIESALGILIEEGKLLAGKNNIDLSDQPPGIYFLNVGNGKGDRNSFKLVKQ
jgi:hypothetical protein